MRIEIKVPESSYPVSEKKRKQILRQVNYQFHKLITEAAGNSCLMEPWSNLRLLWTRLSGLMLSLQFPGIIKASLEEHLEIANSFRQRNPAAAEFAMRAHLETGEKNHLRLSRPPG
jgi:DNA-binding GntR family transcriptional regulator